MIVILVAFACIFVLAAACMMFLDAIARGFGAVERATVKDIVRPSLVVAAVGGLAVGGLWDLVEWIGGFL
jgi:hypothetical protein